MLFIMSVLLCALSFGTGFAAGKGLKPKIKTRKASYLEENGLEGFLSYDGSVQ